MKKIIATILLLLLGVCLRAQSDSTYTLTTASTTSCGVYKSDRLVRTLWSNKTQSAGTYYVNWNKRGDSGQTISEPYTIKVLSNNITTKWKASLGNTSVDSVGPNKIRGLRAVFDGVEVGNSLYFCKGNTEGNSPIFKLQKSNIQKMYELRITGSVDMQTEYVCSDSNLVYWAGYDAWTGFWPITNKTPPDTNSRVKALIYATRVSNDLDYAFSSGKTIKPSLNGYHTYSAIGVIFDDTLANPTGLAVMKSGNYLYCTHFKKSQVRCYNKTTGAFIRTISLPLKNICIKDSVLYGINGNFVKGYKINSNGTLTANSFSVAVTNPLNVKVLNSLVYIVFGATSQVKAYNSSGTLQWTHGQSGGYRSSPYAQNNKFHFIDPNTLDSRGFIVPCRDGSFWVGDIGNCRQMHFSSSRNYIENFSYIPTSYNASASQASPHRVFSGFLEFNADSSKLVANWEGNLKAGYLNVHRREILSDMFVTNNRTFAMATYYPNGMYNDNGRTPEYVELTDTGIRLTGVRIAQSNNRWFITSTTPNGDRFKYEYTQANSGIDTVHKRSFTGLNNSGNPTWGTESVFSLVPITANAPIRYCANKINSSLVFFSASYANTGYHLGKVVNNKWVWMTSKSTPRSYTGPMPKTDSFDCGNGVEYAGGRCYNVDSFYAWNYHGEFWKNSQTNVWKLFHRDGLMLAYFGKTGLESDALSGTHDAPIQASGNSFSGQMVKDGGKLKIYYNDESRHGAVGSFEVSGLNTIKTHCISYPLDVPLPYHLVDFKLKCTNGKITFNWRTAEDYEYKNYTIEYLNDKNIWKVLSTVPTGSAYNQYTTTQPTGSQHLYRLCIVKVDGTKEIVKTINTLVCESGDLFKVYPNPFSSSFTVAPNSSVSDEYQVIILDNMGRVVVDKVLQGKSEVFDLRLLDNSVFYIQIIYQGDLALKTKILKM